jgi:hypothetical protein
MNPATRLAVRLFVMRSARANALVAENTRLARTSRLYETESGREAYRGQERKPRRGMRVVHVRLTPTGAKI